MQNVIRKPVGLGMALTCTSAPLPAVPYGESRWSRLSESRAALSAKRGRGRCTSVSGLAARRSRGVGLGPRADINRCTNRHRTAETFGQILSWLLETVRLRSAPELAVGARRKLTAAHHQPPCGTSSRLFGRGLHLPDVEFVAVVFAERLRALLTAVEPVRKLRRHSRPEL